MFLAKNHIIGENTAVHTTLHPNSKVSLDTLQKVISEISEKNFDNNKKNTMITIKFFFTSIFYL